MFGELRLVAAKDLRVEMRSRIALNQVTPFALLILILFGFALDADRSTLTTFTPGLYWVAVLLASVLAVHRSIAIEAGDGVDDALLMSGLRPSAIFLGKTIALAAQLLFLCGILLAGILFLYGASVDNFALLILTIVAAVVGVAAAGTLYGALIAGQRARETILPILLLPVLAPVLIGATRAFGDAMGSVATNGWAWLTSLVGFSAIYLTLGTLSHGVLVEERS